MLREGWSGERYKKVDVSGKRSRESRVDVSAAAPPAPGGWTADSKGNVTIYRSVADPAVELRLHAPDGDRGAIDAWFASRTEMGPAAQ